MKDHNEPTFENQLYHARKLLKEQGREALNNPHGMTGRTCHCGSCFCCAAALVLKSPPGVYPGENFIEGMKDRPQYRATGEFRPPKKGEFYLSGAVIFAYRAPNDLSDDYWIAERI